jgi:hypothetical protein
MPSGNDQGQWSPSPREWTLTAVQMTRLIYAVESMAQALSGNDRSPDPFPTPVTAVDRIRAQHSLQAQLDIIAAATPGALTPPT